MPNRDVINTALDAAGTPIVLESGAQVARAAKLWRKAPVLALDTEFVRERTFHANLGLVQLSDAQTVWLLDPLEEGTLDPLRELLENPAITKLVHSPSEDLEVLLHVTGAVPEPMIDTQLACALLGKPLQMGYHTAVEWLLDVQVDKDQTRSNWCARPLKPEQLRYAALDVCVLPIMWEILKGRLAEAGRIPWLEEDCQRMLDNARISVPLTDAWKRIKGAGRLDATSLAILARLAAWREKEARKKNRPRGFIVRDPVLMAIAHGKLNSESALAEIEDFHPRARKRYQDAIIGMVQFILENDKQIPPPPRASQAQRTALKQMRHLVSERAETIGLDPALLASRKELELLLFTGTQEGLPGRLAGWRREIIGNDLLELIP